MPTYEYRCTQCGYQYETREGFDAPATQACSRCGGESRRVLYAPPVLFKTSGFYVTDNRKSGLVGSSTGAGSNGGNGEKDSSVESVEAAAPVAESKPASKTPEKTSETAAAS